MPKYSKQICTQCPISLFCPYLLYWKRNLAIYVNSENNDWTTIFLLVQIVTLNWMIYNQLLVRPVFNKNKFILNTWKHVWYGVERKIFCIDERMIILDSTQNFVNRILHVSNDDWQLYEFFSFYDLAPLQVTFWYLFSAEIIE